MMICRCGALAALLTVSALAGCSGANGTDPGRSSASGVAVTSSSGPGPGFPVGPPAKPPATGPSEETAPDSPLTLSGTVAAGVEANCLILAGPSGSHLLIIEDPQDRAAATVGTSVTVVGMSQPGRPTTCQQGTPLVVSAIRAN